MLATSNRSAVWIFIARITFRIVRSFFVKSDRLLDQRHQLLDIGMQVFTVCASAATPRLQLRPFKLDVQRIHKAIHQSAKRGNRRQLDNFGAVEMF